MVVLVLGLARAEVDHVTDDWAVQVDGGEPAIRDVARRHHMDIVDKVFDDVYLLRPRRVVRRSVSPSNTYHHSLVTDPRVLWVEQQVARRRVKREVTAQHLATLSRAKRQVTQQQQQELFLHASKVPPVTAAMEHDLSTNTDTTTLNCDQGNTDHQASPHIMALSDPKWPKMWYLNRGGLRDLNVMAAWREGVTGKGVVVTIVDDGLEKDHPDLERNYDPEASFDFNSGDNDPTPRYDSANSYRHGTRSAGVVAADYNNSVCGVGVAYDSFIGGIRMLDGAVTDAVEASSLAFNSQHIDIYVVSWGPDDNGKTVDGPGQLTIRSLKDGVKNGRGGKGSIFVWASGNGGRDNDNCNCDGYVNSIWTISIASVSAGGTLPWFSETCSSILAATYSSSSSLDEFNIITTDLRSSCTSYHTGNSASANLAAGMCALALQVNPDLTWRDMQHIIVRTARPRTLQAIDWQINGAGYTFSNRFGFGLMDAYGMVELARNWTSVSPQHSCDISLYHTPNSTSNPSIAVLELYVTECQQVNFVEHIQVEVSLDVDRRGLVELDLISPSGTKSTLLTSRNRDASRSGFTSWPFMTLHMWGERPQGKWILQIRNKEIYNPSMSVGECKLIIYGTESEPPPSTSSSSTTPHSTTADDSGDVASDCEKVGGLESDCTVNITYIGSNSESFIENATIENPLKELQLKLEEQSAMIQNLVQQHQTASYNKSEIASILEAHTKMFEAQVQSQKQQLKISQTIVQQIQKTFENLENNLPNFCECDGTHSSSSSTSISHDSSSFKTNSSISSTSYNFSSSDIVSPP